MALIWWLSTCGFFGIVPSKTAVFVVGAVLMVGIWTAAIIRAITSTVLVMRVTMEVEIMVMAVVWLARVSFVEIVSLKLVVTSWAVVWVVAQVGRGLIPLLVGN